MLEKTLQKVVRTILQEINASINLIVLFGSVAQNASLPMSDIDIGILLSQKPKKSFDIELDLAGLFDPEGNPPIQLTLLNSAPLTLQYQVVRDGKVLYQKDPQAWTTFIEDVLSKYPDWRIYLEHYLTLSLEET